MRGDDRATFRRRAVLMGVVKVMEAIEASLYGE